MTVDGNRQRAGVLLQRLLCTTLDLGMALKHAHWNVYGAGFRSLHEHLDELAGLVAASSDALAERAVSLGVSPDGRGATILSATELEPLPAGPLLVDEATGAVARRVAVAADLGRSLLAELSELDAVAADLVLGLVALLERHRWLLLAEFSSSPPARPASP
jgi:starvation-inducible DNA-binding protein